MTYRPKTFTGLLGDIRFERAYYHCEHCHEGHIPWDQVLRLSDQRLTLAAQEVVTLAGIKESFGKVAERCLYKLAGLRLSESTVQRTTEAAGERLGQLLEESTVFGAAESWNWNCDANGQTCGYISVDATGILMQGLDGAKADGRMVYVGMVYNPQPHSDDDDTIAKPCEDVRYLAGLCSLAELGEQLRAQAGQVGMDQVQQWIGMSDGGNGLENFFDVYFPRAVKILDFRHATDYLSALSQALEPGTGGNKLLADWCHQLKHQGGKHLLTVLQNMDRAKMNEAARIEYDKTRKYFENHHQRMDYPTYLRNGWQIGTGSIESACKNVINQRLNMGGMRWGENGGDSLSHLRALFNSEATQWDAFWAHAA